MTAYDSNNIFAKILRGEIPCHKIYEDADTLAFMDIMPQAAGHALIITKAPSRNLLDADAAVFAPLMKTVQKIAHEVLGASEEAVVQGEALHALALKLEQLVRGFRIKSDSSDALAEASLPALSDRSTLERRKVART